MSLREKLRNKEKAEAEKLRYTERNKGCRGRYTGKSGLMPSKILHCKYCE